MPYEERSVCQKFITAEIKVIFASMGSLTHESALRRLQPDIVKKSGGLFKEENRKSGWACSIDVAAFGLERLAISPLNPAAFVVGQASVIVRAEGRAPFHQKSPVDVASQRPISFQSRQHIRGSPPVCNRRFQFRGHGSSGSHAENGGGSDIGVRSGINSRYGNDGNRTVN